MKSVLVLCVAVCVASVATYLVVSNQRAAQSQHERDLLKAAWDAERAELEAALKAAKQRGSLPTASPAADSAAGRSSARDILELLKKTKVQPGDQRIVSVRRIVHELESLVDLGPEALPAIREFLGKFEDVDYSGEVHDELDLPREGDSKERVPPVPGLAAARPGQRLDGILAPSLRLAVVQVLKEIGGDSAEQVLAEMLSTSGRPVEVAYVAKALQDIVPNKYRDIAVAAAKDLLSNPPAIDRPNRLDDEGKNFLYGVLSMYNDQTLATNAHNILVTQDGRVDRTALTYLTSTLKEDSVPALYQAFKDSRVTNIWERASLVSQIFSYAGSSQQANDIFKEVVANDTLPQWLRATAIQTVGGGRGTFFGGAAATDPAQIKARLDLLNSLPDLSDERLARAKIDAIQKLSDVAAEGDGPGAAASFRTRLNQGQSAGGVELPPTPSVK